MSEENIVKQLEAIKSEGNKNNGNKHLYFGGPWFNDVQFDMYKKAYKAVLQNPTLSFIHVPIMNQASGLSPFMGDEVNMDWAQLTFKADETAMENSDVMIALYDADNPDDGTIWETAYMYANHKPVVFVAQGDLFKKPVNLMPAMSATDWITVDDLATYNFNLIMPHFYKGGVI